MLVAQPFELNARFPRMLGRMDIKALIKREACPSDGFSDFKSIWKNERASGRENMPPAGHPQHANSSVRPIFPQPPPTSLSPSANPRPSVLLAQSGQHSPRTSIHPSNAITHYQMGQRPSDLPQDYVPPQTQEFPDWPRNTSPNKRRSPPSDGEDEPPSKKSSTKWNQEENRQVIKLRGQGLKWADVSRQMPGRSIMACRLHYQNYLEKRAEWNEEEKDRLARLYERMKEEMWQPIAAEMGIPWRTVEAMHWIIGEQEMARRANVHPFSGNFQSPTGADSLTPSNLRPRKIQRLSNATHDMSHHGVATLQSPTLTPGQSPITALTQSNLALVDGPLPQPPHISSESRGSLSRPLVSAPPGAESRLQFATDMPVHAYAPSAKYNHISDIQQPGSIPSASKLLPSVAELEEGVSPFPLRHTRRGSGSSGSSGHSSSAKNITKQRSSPKQLSTM